MSHPTPPKTLHLLTLNCWGLKYISTSRSARLSRIGHEIARASPAPDIVALQECWAYADYLSIRAATRPLLPHSKFYHSGAFGSGLVILSAYPITASTMYRYPLNGRPTAFYRGDWFVGKGVACASIRYGPGVKDVLEVFCTHLHAPYEKEPRDSYLCHRTAQAWEIAKLLRGAAERGHLVVGMGDFNMVPLSLAHRLIEGFAPVRDVWRVLYPESSVGAAADEAEKARGRPVPTARESVRENGATCDSALNTWRWSKEDQKRLRKGERIDAEDEAEDRNAKRLDYIFFSPGSGPGSEWRVQASKVGMTARHPTLGCSLSDHFSVEATIVRVGSDDGEKVDSPPRAPDRTLLLSILPLIHTYTARQLRQRRIMLSHLVIAVFISIGCLIGIWWSPHTYVSFIVALISTINLSAGVIDGLIGGLFIGSELRALKEFEWEIRNAIEVEGKQEDVDAQAKRDFAGKIRDLF
ncbi:phospholipase C type enzyme [Xylographa opegraphella]|nr:phospholipase C type enzyme [Xylographa opegraphella]